MLPGKLNQKINALKRCGPNIVSPSDAALTLDSLRKCGIIGGKDAYFLIAKEHLA